MNSPSLNKRVSNIHSIQGLTPYPFQKIGGGPVFNSIKVKIKPGNQNEHVVTGATE